MSGGFREFTPLVGVSGDRVEAGVRDEHVRHEVYLEGLAGVGPGDDVALVGLVLRDPDRAAAESAVVRHVDRVAAGVGGAGGFERWADSMAGVIGESAFLARRIGEWRVFLAVRDGGAVEVGRLVAGSDWLQRKVVAELTEPVALTALAEAGRTKRVRAGARAGLG